MLNVSEALTDLDFLRSVIFNQGWFFTHKRHLATSGDFLVVKDVGSEAMREGGSCVSVCARARACCWHLLNRKAMDVVKLPSMHMENSLVQMSVGLRWRNAGFRWILVSLGYMCDFSSVNYTSPEFWKSTHDLSGKYIELNKKFFDLRISAFFTTGDGVAMLLGFN